LVKSKLSFFNFKIFKMRDFVYNIAKLLLGIRGNLKLLELKMPNCKIYLPDDSIWMFIREIYLLELYFDFKMLKGIVIDAGAHVGAFSIPTSFYAKKVISIEPNPIIVKILELNKMINSRENVEIYPFALYHSASSVKFHDIHISHSGYISENGEGVEVKTIKLDDIIENYDEIELLKMDIEGSEYDVIFNTKIENLKKIKRIVGELHYKDEKKRNEFKSYLEKLGFKFFEYDKNQLYNSLNIIKAIKNSKYIKNQTFYKIMNYIYLLTPLPKPLTPSEQKTPIFVAYNNY
jgi:FkbM family methyltransferase